MNATGQIAQAFALATQHHQAGRLRNAEQLYRHILSLDANHADALHMLGVLAYQAGQHAAAVDVLRRAGAAGSFTPELRLNLGMALLAADRAEDAIAEHRQAIAARPSFPEAHFALAYALQAKGDVPAAIASYDRALSLRPDFPQALANLGDLLRRAGQPDRAMDCFRRAIELRQNPVEAYRKLLAMLGDAGRLHEAVALCPDDPEAYNELGAALFERQNLEEALAAFQRALALRPDYPAALNNLAVLLGRRGDHDAAVALLRRAMAIDPALSATYTNLGNSLREQGDIDGAIENYRRSTALKADPRPAANLLYTLHFHPASTPRSLLEEHRQWDERFARPLLPPARPHPNDRSPDRRLRVGYVSADFRSHPIGRFLLPLFANHDHARVEVFCYSDVRRPDDLTARLRSGADAWRQVLGLRDQQLADLVRQDRIDLLVDLALHMENSRLLTFARKPAPVQVTYLAYCSTTGLSAMDYRLSDPWLDPADEDLRWYSEQTVRLPCYWCYPAPPEAPQVNALPALSAGRVTFGSFNSYAKVTAGTWDAWCELLRRVPDSRLRVHSPAGSHRRRIYDVLEARGIDPGRLEFTARVPTPKYFEQYHQVDLALDPFPYTGGTTTCDALWMGVPTVSLAGQTAVSRGGASILGNAGLAQWVASSTEQYVQTAADLARDLPRLAGLRQTLRGRMQRSPLMDGARFANEMEAAYRKMWEKWCAGST